MMTHTHTDTHTGTHTHTHNHMNNTQHKPISHHYPPHHHHPPPLSFTLISPYRLPLHSVSEQRRALCEEKDGRPKERPPPLLQRQVHRQTVLIPTPIEDIVIGRTERMNVIDEIKE
eukprot:GHVR01163831.1.p1 GENE.GHVR01163831.1~~GHVR01163831.1.p1  ORF type:complete len:116 (-),score=56.99 GHVR01163831.1:81-428(-)